MIIRDDLTPGLQLAQAVHAATAFALAHPERSASTPNVVVLAVPDQATLLRYVRADAQWPEVGELFFEPDVDDQATAYANVCDGARYSCLPLAGRIPAMT